VYFTLWPNEKRQRGPLWETLYYTRVYIYFNNNMTCAAIDAETGGRHTMTARRQRAILHRAVKTLSPEKLTPSDGHAAGYRQRAHNTNIRIHTHTHTLDTKNGQRLSGHVPRKPDPERGRATCADDDDDDDVYLYDNGGRRGGQCPVWEYYAAGAVEDVCARPPRTHNPFRREILL